MKLNLPESGTFNLEVELSSMSSGLDQFSIETRLSDIFVAHCKQLHEAGAEIRLVSSNEKVIDILKLNKAFRQEELKMDGGAEYAGYIWYTTTNKVSVLATEVIPGARIVTTMGIVTYYLDGIRHM